MNRSTLVFAFLSLLCGCGSDPLLESASEIDVETAREARAEAKPTSQFIVHDSQRSFCFPTLIDGVHLDRFGTLVIGRDKFEPFANVREGVTSGRIDIGVTTRPLHEEISVPLVLTVAVRIRKQIDSNNSVLIRLGNVAIGQVASDADFLVDVNAFSDFLDLGVPTNNHYRSICVDVGYFYNDIGDAYCDTFHAVTKGCWE